MTKHGLLAGAVLSFLTVTAVSAAVTPEEAEKLKTTLTPVGAERAGNKDGTIPAWTGGVAQRARRDGEKFPDDLFPDEKPLFSITAQNMAQYGDKLADGTKALLQKYPSYRLDVYPSHRTASFPQYYYDNTFKNATNAKLTDDNSSVKGGFGGVLFPIPKNGWEVIWNHVLRPNPPSWKYGGTNLVGTSDGKLTVASRFDNNHESPNNYPGMTLEKWNGDYGLTRFTTTEPSFKAGESIIVRDNLFSGRQGWQYLVGQRRVRRAPTVAYDTPDFVDSGANYFDEAVAYWGLPDRYDWKLVGKQELYVPYNTTKFLHSNAAEGFVPYHTNPDKVRWELHRVWVLEASLGAGKRHAVPKRRFYIDEDTWGTLIMDGYDAEGKLWRESQTYPFAVPEVPIVMTEATLVYNIQAGSFGFVQDYLGEYFYTVPPRPDNFYTSDSLGAEGVR
jgi:hypothetical protein